MTARTPPIPLIRAAALGFVIAVVHAIDFVGFKRNASLIGFTWMLVMGMLQAIALDYLLVRSTMGC